jgi:pimeloyl-ACP methyl ester carboxylesterase
MKQMKMILLGLVMSVLPLSAVAEGDDAMMSSQILRVINIVPSYQALTVAGQEINATYLEETLGERHGVIVLLHDQGEQFESQGVITPLRHQMPQYGWSTLSLALDFPSETNILLSSSVEQGRDESTSPLKDGVSAESDQQSLPTISNQQRVEAAIALLQAKDIKRIVFIGHGIGESLAVELLENIDTPIAALILVGTADLTMTEEFKTFGQSIFDIYGDNDFVGVEQAVKNRKTMMKRSGNLQYLIRKIDGADHVFSGLQTILVNTIRGWLTTTFLKQEDQ